MTWENVDNTKDKRQTITLRAQNVWFVNYNNQFWEISDVLWQDVMFCVLYSTCKIMWDGRNNKEYD